jgi:hypothetical protein
VLVHVCTCVCVLWCACLIDGRRARVIVIGESSDS